MILRQLRRNEPAVCHVMLTVNVLGLRDKEREREILVSDYYGIPFDAQCCHIGTAIKHPVPDRVESSFVIFDIRALWRSAQMMVLTRSGTGCFIAVPIWQQWPFRGYASLSLYTDGEDHTQCCLRKAVPSPCHDYCAGRSPDTNLKAFLCLAYTDEIFTCFRHSTGL